MARKTLYVVPYNVHQLEAERTLSRTARGIELTWVMRRMASDTYRLQALGLFATPVDRESL